jgi:hypothetical protein
MDNLRAIVKVKIHKWRQPNKLGVVGSLECTGSKSRLENWDALFAMKTSYILLVWGVEISSAHLFFPSSFEQETWKWILMGLIKYPAMMSLLLCTQIASLFLVVKSSLGFSSVFRAHIAVHKDSLGHFKFPRGVIFFHFDTWQKDNKWNSTIFLTLHKAHSSYAIILCMVGLSIIQIQGLLVKCCDVLIVKYLLPLSQVVINHGLL